MNQDWKTNCSNNSEVVCRCATSECGYCHLAEMGGNLMRPKLGLLALVLSCLLLTGTAFAGVCPGTTLDNYIGSGYSCGIGDKTFSNFMYSGTSNPPGYGLPAGSIGVTPITTPGNPGFQF